MVNHAYGWMGGWMGGGMWIGTAIVGLMFLLLGVIDKLFNH